MRIFFGLSCVLLLAGTVCAQGFRAGFSGGGFPGGTFSGGTPFVAGGFGNAVLPAGTPQNFPGIQRFTPNAVFPAGGGPRLVIPGQGPQRFTKTGGTAFSFGYPVYVGGYGEPAYDQPPGQAPVQPPQNITVIYPPQAAPVITSPYGQPMAPAMQPPDREQPISPYQPQAQNNDEQPERDHYLIAFKDHTIYSVVAYWVSGDTLHYFTPGNVHNQVSLSLVDRDLTIRLNRESGVDVQLPAAK